MHKMTLRKIVKLSALKDAKHNPKNRTSDHAIKNLEDSMDLIGLLHPISITPENVIVDGHRRATCARKLGWKEIECNVVHRDADEVYASVNRTSRKLSGNDALGVWLENYRAVPISTDRTLKKIETEIGRVLLKKIYNAGLSIRIYKTAKTIVRYCREDGMLEEAINWLIQFAVIGQVMKAIEAGQDPSVILKAIRAKKPIKMRIAVA